MLAAFFGRPIRPTDPNVLDVLLGDAPMMDSLAGLEEPALPGILAKHGPFESDEDLLLLLFLHPAAYNSFKKNKKPIDWNPRRCPVTARVKALANRAGLESVEVERGPLKLALSGRLNGLQPPISEPTVAN